MDVYHWVETVILIYLVCGSLFAIWFLVSLVNRMDDRMPGSSVLMRLMLLPGTVLLWPGLWIHYRKSKSRTV